MRRKTPKRKTIPDPKFQSVTIAKLINYIMQRGKKSVAERIVYNCFNLIKEKTKQDGAEIFDRAIKNVGPEIEVRSRRVGGANYQIPTPVHADRRLALALRWIIAAAKSRKGMPMEEKLTLELIDASNKTGAAFKKREDTYRMAEANRAFAHFARF